MRSGGGDELAEPVDMEEVMEGEFYILDMDGELYYPDEYSSDDENFMNLVRKEVFSEPIGGRESPHIKYLSKLRIAEPEPYSDAGHLTYLPNGALMLNILREYSTSTVLKIGANPVITSIMYDLDIPAIKKHAELFGQRMYKVKPGKREFVLRYAACFGQFALLRRKFITYRDLPLRVFELADSYRYEQRGELKGLTRTRRFFMPDMHVLTRDLEMAKDEFRRLYELIFSEGRKFGFEYYSLYNISVDFLRDNMDFLRSLLEIDGKPVLLKTVEAGKYYWVLNVEFHYIDSVGRPVETATVQIDIGNGERFGIEYVDEDGSKKYPVILHTAIHGSVERFLFEFLEEAAKMERRGEKPRLPTWLSPTQVRLIPVSPSDHLGVCEEFMSVLESRGIRVDIDDRDASVGRRVKDAESSWIPYICVVGDEEARSGRLRVRVRATGETVEMGVEELAERVSEELEGFPRLPLYVSRYLSRRPSFV